MVNETRRHRTVRREFDRGPLAALEGGIELEPVGEHASVRAFADYTPANWTGRFLWRMGNATVTDLLRFCDEYLSRRAAGRPDPVPVPGQSKSGGQPADAPAHDQDVRLHRSPPKIRG